ncbi:MAG: GNAT family N-acetyltransferase [Thermoplasmataceae archaeon]
MVIKIRKLSLKDIEAPIKVARESWKWTYEGIYSEEYIENWIREKYSNENLANEIARSESNLDILFLGSFSESILTGFIELKFDGDKAELLRLYLKPEFTHRQIGKLLLLEAEKIMRERDILQCRLYVH